MSAQINFQLQNIHTINTVTWLSQNVIVMHQLNVETIKMNLREITNSVCLIKSLLNDKMYPKTTW